MKRSKRQENSIIIHFVLYFILVVVLVVYAISTLYPKIVVIENDKTSALSTFENYKKIEREGISMEDFKSLVGGNQTKVLEEIIASMSDGFFDENLHNKWSETYETFLSNKTKELNAAESDDLLTENNAKVLTVLPLYSEESIDLWEFSLTDYKFVNYVESIVESFNFSTNSSIGIWKINLLEDFAVGNTKWESLDSNIYYIPLTLILKGTKESIIDFLYFVENVWGISVDDNKIMINDDQEFLEKNGIPKVLEWEKISKDYNIFNHQIVDIKKLEMQEYIDSSYTSRGEEEFIKFLLSSQGNEKFEIKVDLMFYVKGQPAYKIEEYILSVMWKHKETQWLVAKELKREDLRRIDEIRLKKSEVTLQQLSKELNLMRKELSKKENLEELFKKAIKYDELINPIYTSLKQ